MRLILTILLIGLFKAEGQIVINASSPYRPLASPFTGLLDDYSGASVAYSLRKLDKDYSGAAIRVRKDTTGQPEQDINFTASGDLDTAALKSFLNARSGFITTWYDQSGNTKNATQTVQANQPRIATLGVLERQNGKVCISYTSQNLIYTETTRDSSQAYCIWKTNASTNIIPFGSTQSVGIFYGAISNSTALPHQNYGSPKYYKNLDAQLASTRLALQNAYITNAIVLSYILELKMATPGDNSIWLQYPGLSVQNYIFEYIIYRNLTNNRTGISNNINTYYIIW